MKKQAQLVLYVAVAALFVAAFIASPAAWATPSRSASNQTVPTRTPTTEYIPTDLPTTQPPTQQPAPTAALPPPTGTALPQSTAAPAALTLVIDPARKAAWPGAAVSFAITAGNQGPTAVRQVLVDIPLPAGLEPGDVTAGGAIWEGNSLRLRLASLPGNGRATVTFTVRVAATATAQALVLRPVITAADGMRATATAVIALAPVELPTTGGRGATVGD
jgi:hypothetical protein